MYFYSKAVEEMGENNVDIAAFRYDSMPPSTKEGAVLLLCDTIEAAVRSMRNPTPDAIEEFIVKLVRGKLQDGQLSLSPLTLRDIDAICKACTTVLNGVFHERIEYPDPPASMQKVAEIPHVSIPDAAEPWDGETQPVEMSEKETLENTLYTLPFISSEEAENLTSVPVIVAPEQFEPLAPIPVVEPPVSVAPVSIDDVLKSTQEKEEE